MKVATFVLLADPQAGWYGGTPQEYGNLSLLNNALNNIGTVDYPNDPSIGYINCSGPVGKPDAVFIAGDLTNYGGQVNIIEWILGDSDVATNLGGPLLTEFRTFYDPGVLGENNRGWILLDGSGPLYFGLGNHDVNTDSNTVQWRGFNHELMGNAADYYRYQMWNFINQMHVGYHRTLNGKPVSIPARFPISPSDIDADPLGTFYYQSSSFNYVIDLGPLDIYQLHLFGGDSLHGRKSGLDWLKQKLALKGYSRPFMIVQHLPPGMTNRVKLYEGMWNDTATDQLLEILRPYNFLGFGVGHLHREAIHPVTSSTGGMNTQEFQVGAAFDRKFGIVRVEEADGGDVTTNVVWGYVEPSGLVKWTMAWAGKSQRREVYLSGVEVVRLNAPANDWSHDLPYYVTEESGKSANINDGFGGHAIYLKPLLTTDASQAITGFDLVIQNEPIPNMQDLDLADDSNFDPSTGKQHRYLVTKRESGEPPVKQLFLWRSDGQQAPRIGWKLSPNLNEGREGYGLYLEWEAGCAY